jgi:hypothetical protein
MVMEFSNILDAEETAETFRFREHALSMAGLTDCEKPVLHPDHSPSQSSTTLDTASIYSADNLCAEPMTSTATSIGAATVHVPDDSDRELLSSVTTLIGDYDPLSPTADVTDRYIPILEARGGTDKDATGHRRDSTPIGHGVIDHGGFSAIVQYQDDVQGDNNDLAAKCNEALFRHLHKRAKGVIVRNNPGTLCPAAQAKLDTLLTELSEAGVLVLSTPELIRAMGAKDALVKIKHLQVGIQDTSVYTTPEQLWEGFRMSIAFQPRVIKQNRGSQGEGIWICKLQDESQYCENYGDVIADLDTPLVLMEAFDNHVEIHTVAEFIEFCVNGRTDLSGEWSSTGVGRYLEGGIESGAMLVDQRFLPRIVEGEVRCTMVGSELIGLVHKKPQEGGLSCTLQSGAIYTNYSSDAPEFSSLVNKFRTDIPHILECFGMTDQPLPLLWTADFIYGNPDENGNDTFFVGEFNCSCVGVTQQLEFADLVGKTALEYATVGYGGQGPM